MEIRVKIEPQGERAAQTKPAARIHGSEAMGAEGGVSGPRIIEGCTLLRPAVRQRFKGWQRLPRHPGNPRVHRWGNCGPRRCQELGSAMASWKGSRNFRLLCLFTRGSPTGGARDPSPWESHSRCLPGVTVTALLCSLLRLGDRSAHAAVALSPIPPESDRIPMTTQGSGPSDLRVASEMARRGKGPLADGQGSAPTTGTFTSRGQGRRGTGVRENAEDPSSRGRGRGSK